MSQRYPTDLTDTEWTVLTPLIPAAKPRGRCLGAAPRRDGPFGRDPGPGWGQTGFDSLGRPLHGTAAHLGGWGIRGQARHVGRDGAATDPRHRETPPAHPRFSGGAMALD